ncbi:MAG: type II toxin-antitoxin system PemK/MazF family toxin [Verrucomicrobiota bacterium]
MTKEPSPGDVFMVDFGMAAKVRPCVVLSRHDPAAARAVCIVAPFTTSSRESPYEIPVPKPRWLTRAGVVNLQGLVSMGLHDLGRHLGKLPTGDVAKIKDGLRFVLDL